MEASLGQAAGMDANEIGAFILIGLAAVLAMLGVHWLTAPRARSEDAPPRPIQPRAQRITPAPDPPEVGEPSPPAPTEPPTVQRNPAPSPTSVNAAGAARSIGRWLLQAIGAVLFVGWLALGALESCVVVDTSGDTPSNPVAERDSGCGPNEWCGYDLDCADIAGPVEITGSDPHGLDRDGDGMGCE